MKSIVHDDKPFEIIIYPAPRTWVLVLVFVLTLLAVIGSIISQVMG